MKKTVIILLLTIMNLANAQDLIVSSYPVKLILQELTGVTVDIRPIIPYGANPYSDSVRNELLIRGAKIADAFIYISEEYEPWVADIPAKKKIALFDLLPPEMMLDKEGYQLFDKKILEKLNQNIDKNYSSKRPKKRNDILKKYLSNKKINPYFWTDPVAVQSIMPALTDSLAQIMPLQAGKFATNLTRFDSRLNGLNLKIRQIIRNTKYKSFYQLNHKFDYFINRYKLYNVGALSDSQKKGITHLDKSIFYYITKMELDSAQELFLKEQYKKNNSPAVYSAKIDNPIKNHEMKSIKLFLYYPESPEDRYFDLLTKDAMLIKNTFQFFR